MGKPKIIKLTDEERKTLFFWLRSGTTEYRLVERAKIILAAAEGAEYSGHRRESEDSACPGEQMADTVSA